jgi:hypothetical protein
LAEKSLPVQSPSYVMGGSFNYRIGSKKLWKEQKIFNYLSIGVFHHSNGQKEPLIADYDLDIINTENGSFSTNYLRTAYSWGYMHKNHLRTASVGLETQVFHIPNLGKRYGTLRPYLHYTFINIEENDVFNNKNTINRFRFEADVQWIFGRLSANDKSFDPIKRLNIEAKAFYLLKKDWNLSAFSAVGYTGQDQYNIYFRNHYPFMRFGVSFAGPVVYAPF